MAMQMVMRTPEVRLMQMVKRTAPDSQRLAGDSFSLIARLLERI